MSSIDMFAAAGVVLVVVSIGILLFSPTDKNRWKKKRATPNKEHDENKDWKAVSLKLEKHIHGLRREIGEVQKNEKRYKRELEMEREKNKRARDKLAQERGWHDKELKDIKRKTDEVYRVRQDMVRLEQDLEGEHSAGLKREREIKTLKEELAALSGQKNELDAELVKLKAISRQYRIEIRDLKARNAELSKRREDTQWIAKSEYDKLQKKLNDIKGR